MLKDRSLCHQASFFTALKQAMLQRPQITKVRELKYNKLSWFQLGRFLLPNAFAFTMLGDAAGGGAFSLRNGSTLFGSAQTGYFLIFPCG